MRFDQRSNFQHFHKWKSFERQGESVLWRCTDPECAETRTTVYVEHVSGN